VVEDVCETSYHVRIWERLVLRVSALVRRQVKELALFNALTEPNAHESYSQTLSRLASTMAYPIGGATLRLTVEPVHHATNGRSTTVL
jgi:hypothetical protein